MDRQATALPQHPAASGPGGEEGRRRAGTLYQVLMVVQILLGVGLLVSASLAVYYSLDTESPVVPPYFIGGFVAGGLVLFGAFVSWYIYIKGSRFNDSDDTKLGILCAIGGSQSLAIFTLVGCILGVVFVVLGGLCLGTPCYYTNNTDKNRALAISILALCVCVIVCVICTIVFSCIYGPYYGVIANSGRGRMVVRINQGVGRVTILCSSGGSRFARYNQSVEMVDRQPEPNVWTQSNPELLTVEQLQQQNKFLQQQLQLQQQQKQY